jgi:hypothetical protein
MLQMLSIALSIILAAPPVGELMVRIPASISLKEQEVRANLPGSVRTRGGYDRIEIIIYYFSQGIEKFSYGDNNAMRESQTKGEIKALVKLKRNNVLRKALFLKASGTSREQILHNFSNNVAEILSGQ